MYFLGIDPGVAGGFALIDEKGDILPSHVWKNPLFEKETSELFRFGFKGLVRLALIEKVHSMPKMGIQTMFKFGQGYGFLRACLVNFEIPFDEIPPITWQRYQHCLTGGNKNISKAKAMQLWPRVKVTHHVADAMLIAKHCMEDYSGKLAQPVKVIRNPKPIMPPDLEDEFAPRRKVAGQKVLGDTF